MILISTPLDSMCKKQKTKKMPKAAKEGHIVCLLDYIVSVGFEHSLCKESLQTSYIISSNIYIYIYICRYFCYTNLPVNAMVTLPHPRSRDRRGQERFLAPSADKQTCIYDTECSNHHPSLSTLRSKGLSHSKVKW